MSTTNFSLELNQQSGEWPDAVTQRCKIGVYASIDHLGLEFSQPTELSVLLTDDDTIADLNEQWRKKSGPTNVLTFPQIEPFATPIGLLGDIILASQTLYREAKNAAIKPEDHFTHLVIHGFLHILGYDHIESNQAELMESHERAILANLNIADPYADSDLPQPGS